MSDQSPRQVLVEPKSRRVVRYHRDMVGNDLTAHLAWCETHDEPLWVFSDGSYTCPHARATLVDDGDHVIVNGPWEMQT